MGLFYPCNSSALQPVLCCAALRKRVGGWPSGESPCDGWRFRAAAFLSDRWLGRFTCDGYEQSSSRFSSSGALGPVLLRFTFCLTLLAAVFWSRLVVPAAAGSLIVFHRADLVGFFFGSG